MAHVLHHRHPQVLERRVDDDAPAVESASSVAARVVGAIGGVIMALLGLRFMLALLGANASNGFVSFIYDISRPFAAPFFGIFNYDTRLGVSRFEFETLIALVVYAVATWALTYLLTMTRRRSY